MRCSTYKPALGTKERQKRDREFQERHSKDGQKDLGCFEGASEAVCVCLCLAACSPFRVGIFLDGHTCQVVIRGIMN